MLLLCGNAHALDVADSDDNTQLKALYDADQERTSLFRLPQAEREAAKKKIFAADIPRLQQVKEMLGKGEIRTAEDYWRAAFIAQHGADVDAARLAFSLGTIATVLAPETKKYRWITAASWDRILTMNNQPQWYGTQFKTDQSTGKQVQERIAEGAVTDAEREALGVPTLKESEDMLKEINGEQSP